MRKRKSFFQLIDKKNPSIIDLLQKTISIAERFKSEVSNSDEAIQKIREDSSSDSLYQEIQEIKQTLEKQTKDIECLYVKNAEEKLQGLEVDVSLMKVSHHHILCELETLKALLEENIDDTLGDHNYLVQAVLVEIYQKFISITGGMLRGSIDMNNHPITGLDTPQNAKDSNAASVGYVRNKLDPIEEMVNTTKEKVDSHEEAIRKANFRMMTVSGGKFRGLVDMDGNRITGLGNPKSSSDAISLGFLEKYLGSQDAELPHYDQVSSSNMLYSRGLNIRVEHSLPTELVSQGVRGFVWLAKNSNHAGYFPMTSMEYALENEENQCFVLEDNQIQAKHPGVYTVDFTFKALIPTLSMPENPYVQLKVHYSHDKWNLNTDLTQDTSCISLSLNQVGTVFIGGQSYNIVELPAGTGRVLTVSKNYSASFGLINPIQDLYVIHASYACSWKRN